MKHEQEIADGDYIPIGKQLLIGCGHRRDRLIDPLKAKAAIHVNEWYGSAGTNRWPGALTTLDNNPNCRPDVVFDLLLTDYEWDHFPFDADSFSEIHGYEVLEHIGSQGDAELLFQQFSEFWRLLEPGGFLCATVPWWQGPWAWGDPSHRRVIQPETLTFLHQPAYAELGKTARSDFRSIYRADFDIVWACNLQNETFGFVLQAVKPSRWVAP